MKRVLRMKRLSCGKRSRWTKCLGWLAAAVLLCSSTAHADEPRINQALVLGSHNSYHPVPDAATLVRWRALKPGGYPNLEYGHPSLTTQLDLGLRQIEIDVYADSEGGLFAAPYPPHSQQAAVMARPGLKVLHIWKVDQRSNCLTLEQCLTEVRQWSDRHPGHDLLTILINPNDIDAAHLDAAPELMSAASLDELDRTSRKIFGHRLLTPDDVRASHSTLREAAMAQDWPTVAATRGHIMMALDVGPVLSEVYRQGHPSLAGRALFGFFPENSPEAALFNISDPRLERDRIERLVREGFIVRTRSDADTVEARNHDYSRLEAAIASGAQIISTDYYPGAPDPLNLHFVVSRAAHTTTGLEHLNPPSAPGPTSSEPTVERVVLVFRHGIRAPLPEEQVLPGPTPEGWPTWTTPAGELSPHGREAARLMGDFERQWLSATGLLPAHDCPTQQVAIWANNVERTLSTAAALATGLAPGCSLPIGHRPQGEQDPLFKLSAARPSNSTLADLRSNLRPGAGAAEALLLQYAEGQPAPVDAPTIEQLSALHALQLSLDFQDPLSVHQNAATLKHTVMAHLVSDQGPPVMLLVGHDGNISALTGELGIHFKVDGYSRDEPPLGGALVFERIRTSSGERLIHVSYHAQTLKQLRDLTPLTLSAGPSTTELLTLPAPGTHVSLRENRTPSPTSPQHCARSQDSFPSRRGRR